MNNKVDYFQKKMSHPRSFARRQNRSRIWLRILFIILILCIWCLILFRSSLNSNEPNNAPFEFSLWEEVHLQWEIMVEGDITHMYTINDVNYWKIWIKSDSIDLSSYVGYVELTWMVEKFYQWSPIVRVVNISGTLWDGINVVSNPNNSSSYVPKAWILFLPEFYEKYLLKNDWENGKFIAENIESGKEIEIKYFRCNDANPDRNCKWLTETFINNKVQSFETSENDVYYKNKDTEWFVANGERRGIYINNVSDDIVFELKDLIKFANKKNIDEWIKTRAASICQWSWEMMQKINNSEVTLKQEWLIVTVSGDGMEKQMTCQILVDFSLPSKWQLQSLTIWDTVVISNETWSNEELNTETTWNIVEAPISATSLDTNVPQNPLKKECLETPDKEGCLKYESVRWGYILNFPSSNISFSVSSVKENFGRNDVNCSYVINVIKYTDKENLEISPAVRIYECDWSVEKSWAQWIVVYPRLNKKFIVQMNDGAWNDFSMNLRFRELAEE